MRRSIASRAASTSSVHASAEEVGRVEVAEHEVGVGHGRLACRRGRSRPGPGSAPARVGADLQQAERVDARDRAAAGADLDHVDRPDLTGSPEPRLKRYTRSTSNSCAISGSPSLDHAQLGRRAAHVEREQVGDRRRPSRRRGRERARRPGPTRAGARGSARPSSHGGDAAAREHDVQRPAEARAARAALEIGAGTARRRACT